MSRFLVIEMFVAGFFLLMWYNFSSLRVGGMIVLTVWEAALLGVVQGLGEFLPISSSAHLVLLPWFFGWQYAGLRFDVALHLGTLLAVLFYFWQDWLVIIYEGLTRRQSTEGRLFWYLLLATFPGALVGYFLEDYAETIFRSPLIIGVMLIVMAVILYLSDTLAASHKKMHQLSFADSLLIGLSQALAIIPGVSRSGVTMSMGRILGLSRETAARFSFLLSTPIVVGAGLLKLKDLSAADLTPPFITGVVVSALVGFLAIKFLLRYLVRNTFNIFVGYRILLGMAVIVLAALRGQLHI